MDGVVNEERAVALRRLAGMVGYFAAVSLLDLYVLQFGLVETPLGAVVWTLVMAVGLFAMFEVFGLRRS